MRLSDLRSSLLRSEIAILGADGVVQERAGYLRLENRTNPDHWWGNILIFAAPPIPGDGARWLDLWQEEFGDRYAHRTFTWDGTDGELGAVEEFRDAGFRVELTVAMMAGRDEIRRPAKYAGAVKVRPLRLPEEEAMSIELALASSPEYAPDIQRSFLRSQMRRRADAIASGSGFWLGAFAGEQLVGQLGLFDIGGGLGRYQAVDTHPDWRRRGIASRLTHEAAIRGFEQLGLERLLIAADEEYFARHIYESIGFRSRERSAGVCRPPPGGMIT